MRISVQVIPLSNKSFHMPKHTFNALSLLGLLEYSLALEVVKTIRDAFADFDSLIGFFIYALNHKLPVAIACYELQLDRNEEESDALEHHRGQTFLHRVNHIRLFAEPKLFRAHGPKFVKSDCLREWFS